MEEGAAMQPFSDFEERVKCMGSWAPGPDFGLSRAEVGPRCCVDSGLFIPGGGPSPWPHEVTHANRRRKTLHPPCFLQCRLMASHKTQPSRSDSPG